MTQLQFTFQKFLKLFHYKKFSVLQKIIYFSDGFSGQYKNRKNLLNLCLHKDDFGVPAEWHFLLTAMVKDLVTGWVVLLKERQQKQAYNGHIPIKS